MNLRDVADAVNARKVSAQDVALSALERRAKYDAFQPEVWIDRIATKDVLAAARAVDARIAAGENLRLAGVPFAVKDNIDVVGRPTTAACPSYAYSPEHSAFVVQRLIDAGAVLVGKTNMDQFATGLVGVRSPYGAPRCVFNRDYVSGGSSSGSAVAVAAGVVAFALGTDTAGSGRVPAAFNNIIGFKPTKGRWSTSGVVPACRSLDCVTVFTCSAAESALIDEVLNAFDDQDIYARQAQAAPKPPKHWRIGVPRADQLNLLGDVESAALFAQAKARAEKLGAKLKQIDIAPLLDCARLLYQGPWVAERTAALADVLEARPSIIHPIVRQIVEGGRTMSATDAFRGAYQLKHYERAAAAMWRDIDALLLPTAPTIYRVGEVLAEPIALNANLGLYTNFVNLLDMAAIALPAGFRNNGAGFGVTFIGPAWSDSNLFYLASLYEKAAPMQEDPLLDLSERAPRVKLAVVGAHLHGMPLHWQLTSRDARLAMSGNTAPTYKLYAMATQPPKPALIHVGEGGASIAVEVYELTHAAFGAFVEEVPAPLAIGTVTLDDGTEVKGFVAEPRAMKGAEDVTHLGGWRAYIASKG